MKFVCVRLMLCNVLPNVLLFYIMKRSKLLRERGYAITYETRAYLTTNWGHNETDNKSRVGGAGWIDEPAPCACYAR